MAMSCLLTRSEAAVALGLATSTLDDWRTKRKGPVYLKIGGSVRYRREDITEFLTGCEVSPVEGAIERVKREVVRPLRSGRRGVLGANRFGGHRTKADKAAAKGK
jgi:predicted DNA-binding transcriptional regulator AlpA